MKIKLDYIHVIDDLRFFASLYFCNNNTTCLCTYGYDGEWFFVGYGSSYHNIYEVRNNPRKANYIHYSHKPEIMAIDHIFKFNRLSIEEILKIPSKYVVGALKSVLREYKINEVLN